MKAGGRGEPQSTDPYRPYNSPQAQAQDSAYQRMSRSVKYPPSMAGGPQAGPSEMTRFTPISNNSDAASAKRWAVGSC